MRLEDYLRQLRRRWFVVVVFAALGLAVASLAVAVQRPMYASTAESFLTVGSGGSVNDLTQGTTFTQEAVKGYARIATTEYVLAPVDRELRLGLPLTVLADRVEAVADPDTAVIEITATDPSPARAAAIANAVTDRLASSVPELTAGSGGDVPQRITKVQSASVPTSPVSPNLPLTLVLGLLTGLVLGAGLALAREALDTRLHEPGDVEQAAQIASLGEILYDAEASARPLVVASHEGGVETEAYSTLRANLQFLTPGASSQALVMTSAIPGEGKSTTAANLALSLARLDQEVVLVDADLRHPRQQEICGIDGTVGLVDVLIGAVTLDEALQTRGPNGLRILPAGRVPPNPSELLQSAEMASLVTDLRERFATVLFDTPPLLPVTDAVVLAKQVDGAVVVTGLQRVRRAQLRQALHALRRADVPILGFVATMVRRRGTSGYGYPERSAVAQRRTPRAGQST